MNVFQQLKNESSVRLTSFRESAELVAICTKKCFCDIAGRQLRQHQFTTLCRSASAASSMVCLSVI